MAVTPTEIRAFLAVKSTGSVHAVAAQLLVSQPSVPAAVSSLARELRAALFERHGRPGPPGRPGDHGHPQRGLPPARA